MAANRMPGARAAPFYEIACGPRLGRYFGLSAVPFLATPEQAPHFAVTRLSGRGGLRPRRWIPAEPACLVILQLIPARFQTRHTGRDMERHECGAGSIGLEMLDDALLLSFRGVFDCLSFYIQHRFLDEAVHALGLAGVSDLRCRHGTQDDVLWSIGQALLPLLAVPERASPAFIDHISRAIYLYLLHTYGGSRSAFLS